MDGYVRGYFYFRPGNNTLHDYSKILGLVKNHPVFNIMQDADGALWFTSVNTLVKVTKKTINKKESFQTEIFKSPDIKSTMYSLYLDNEKRIWVGTTSSGVFSFDPGTKKFTAYNYHEMGPHSKLKEVNVFCELSKDSILVGGVSTGLLLLHVNSNRYEKINLGNTPGVPADASVNEIYKIGDDVWIGTQYNGLWKTNTRFKKPEVITVNDGLPSMGITSMVVGKQNNLWITTNSGVVEYDIPDKKIILFNKNDGIQDLDELNTLISDSQGNVVIGSRGCLYNITPSQLSRNTHPPKVFITNLKIFDKDYNVQKSAPIELNYHQNYFSLEYVGLNYTRSKLNRYAYKMDGLDKKWNDAASRRYVSYANLEEGTYTFNVKASNNDGVWNNIPARLVLIINPPFWHRWWFYLLTILFFASLIYIIYAYNIRQLRLRRQIRDKIARDLHDDIGSTLSGINIFSKIALQQMHAGQPGLELMEKISDRSKITMDALSDIVWSINTRYDTMDNFLVKANEYFSVLDVQNIAYDFTVDEDIRQLKIGMILKKELYLIFKEAVCNASKYARCTFLQIYLTHHKDMCTLSIHDNGKGFDISKVTSGNGIYNMQQRAKKINADFHIESAENKGTTITLKFRITQYR
jgi:two-component sensor histidine kinase